VDTADPPTLRDDSIERRYRTLLDVFESITTQHDPQELFRRLAKSLHRVVAFDFLAVTIYEPERDTVRLHILESSHPTSVQPGFELPFRESPTSWVLERQQALVVPDIEQETRFPRVSELVRQHGVKSYCLLPLVTAQRWVGALGFGSIHADAYAHADLEFMQRVAGQVAVALDNALNFASARSYQQQLTRERDRLQVLLAVNNAVVSNLDTRQLFDAISSSLRGLLRHEYTSLALHDPAINQLRLTALDFPAGKGLIQEEMLLPVEGTPAGTAFTERKPILLNHLDLERFHPEVRRLLLGEGMKSFCCLPLTTREGVLGTLNLGSLRENALKPEDLELLQQVANQVAIAVENALAFRQIAALKDKLAEEKLYLEDEIDTDHNFEEIIGESTALKRVLVQVETVAPTASTVLILGETGTGKEAIARGIHKLSARRERTFVKVNCAAIPTGLLESELFGHEKGAFTGAILQRIGRFELAHQGTIFLDEVGDIPLELQPKLLRVLQEKEFERLGSTHTVRVDVRLIAATNRDLIEMVAGGAFRRDLYYRLNVFPIVVPPLRERRQDIPLMVRYFAQKYARQMNKRIDTIPAEVMETLTQYPWPGNVRELENLIERAVILSPGSTLRVPLGELKTPGTASPGVTTLEEAEREHILHALRESNWIIGGPRGAAARLGLKRTTLQSKMNKLGITRRDQ